MSAGRERSADASRGSARRFRAAAAEACSPLFGSRPSSATSELHAGRRERLARHRPVCLATRPSPRSRLQARCLSCYSRSRLACSPTFSTAVTC
jgi:hypothetical protein